MRKLILYSLFVFLLIGCGGGGSGNSGVVKIISDAQEVAYKSDSQDWSKSFKNKKDLNNGVKEYSIEAYGKYKIALKCSNDSYYLIALNAKSDKEFNFNCPFTALGLSVTINGSINDSVDGLNNFIVANKTDYEFVGSANSYTLQTVADNSSDILAITHNNAIPKRFIAIRDKKISAINKTFNIDFTNSNSVEIKSKAYNLAGQTIGDIFLVTKNRTYFKSSLGNFWYYPSGLLLDSDYFVFTHYISANSVFRVKNIQAKALEKKDYTIDLSYIKPLNSLSYSGNKIKALNSYSPSDKSQKFRGYIIDLENSNLNRDLHIMVSNDYLNGDSDFAIDDLSQIAGFEAAWSGAGATKVEAAAIMSSLKLGVLMQTEHFLHIKKFEHFPFKEDSTIEVATQTLK